MTDPVLPTTDIAWDVASALLNFVRGIRPALAGVTISDGMPGDTQTGQHLYLTGIVNAEIEPAGFAGPDITIPSDEMFDITLELAVAGLPSYEACWRRAGEVLGAIGQAVRANATLESPAHPDGVPGLSWILPAGTRREAVATTERFHVRGEITLSAMTTLFLP